MTFPQTRPSLIQRISAGGSPQDWQQFLEDYWGPICRFAARRSNLSAADAEDVASQTFEGLLTNKLLIRWQQRPTAKLRTLICRVVLNVLSNRARVAQGRQRLLREYVDQGGDGPLKVHDSPEVAEESDDFFYTAWADELLKRSVDSLMVKLHGDGKGDYFRVLYGRLCEEMSNTEMADALGLEIHSIENYYKAAKKRLAEEIEQRVRQHIERYGESSTAESEFAAEWSRLGEFFVKHGGLEQAVRRCYQESRAGFAVEGQSAVFRATKRKLACHG